MGRHPSRRQSTRPSKLDLSHRTFLYDIASQKWRLSPAYDLNPVPITERRRILATWPSEAGPEAAIDSLLEAAPDFALKAPRAREIVREVADVTRQWRDVGRQLGLSDADLAPYETAFEHEELRVALRGDVHAAPAQSAQPRTPAPDIIGL